jgi:hypothetical protein
MRNIIINSYIYISNRITVYVYIEHYHHHHYLHYFHYRL